ncbi:EpsG family protein, partial [Fodinibius sp. SL11]|uniref:EpsG family protein n=1 Tax=Fodinibius sp. SL11 TaxID=3425690 RepID=UPI003F885553
MESLNDKSGYYAVILFLIWPFLALASAFKNYSSSWGKNILWAFVAFYGFAFAIGAESVDSDITRYVQEVEYLHGIDMSPADAIEYYKKSGEVDVLRTFIAVTVSRVTGSQAVLTLIYGIIFGFFFSRNIWFVLERLEGKIKPITILLIACLFLIIPIWKMNGFRFWTAAHIFIYGLLPFLFDNKKGKILFCFLSLLVHFAFLVPVAILLSYLIAGNRLVIYFIFFLATFFITEINLTAFNNIIDNYAPEIIQERSSSYRGEDKVEAYRDGVEKDTVWYAIWYGRALGWSVMGFLIVLFWQGKAFFENNRRWKSLFSFVLLFCGIANLFSSLPSGGRYSSIANL